MSELMLTNKMLAVVTPIDVRPIIFLENRSGFQAILFSIICAVMFLLLDKDLVGHENPYFELTFCVVQCVLPGKVRQLCG